MKKIFIFIIALFSMPLSISALSANISGPNSVEKGSNVTVSVNLIDTAAWNIKISSGSCSNNFADVTGNGLNTNKTLNLTCNTGNNDNITFYVSGDITSEDGNNQNVSLSKTIDVYNPRIKESESRLKSLSVDGYNLNKNFDSNDYEYVVSVPLTETKININALTIGNNANVIGIGTYEISENGNIFIIKVTAEDGSVSEYKINVLITDPNPINVEIENENYTVVKQKSKLEKIFNYEETTIEINGISIPAYKSDITHFTIIGLQNNDGNIKYAIVENNNYKLYNEVSSNNLNLYITSGNLENYKKIKTEINDISYDTYKLNDRFVICYAMDISSGTYNYYKYDTIDKTFQYYEIKENTDQNNKYKINIYFITTIIFLIISITLIIFIIYNFKKKKINYKTT